jgi:DNA polymerase-3 subunit epsilon
MYLPNFLDGFDRLVAFDAETTGKHTPDAEFIRKQPFAWRAPGIIIEVGFVEMLREGEGWRKGGDVAIQGQPGWANRPGGHQAPQDSTRRSQERSTVPDDPADGERLRWRLADRGSRLQKRARFPRQRDFLDYEFARAKVIQWGESAYAEEGYICTQVLFAQLFPGSSKSLTSMCDRLVLDSSERDDRHGALLDADMTADALILLERQLKHGESGAPRSWTSS